VHFLRASVFNFECLDILPDSIGHPSKKLLSFEFDQSFHFPFGGSQYILGLCWTSKLKRYCRLNCLRASVFNFEHLDILRDSIGHTCIKLLSFEFATSLYFEFGASRYIMGLNRTSEKKVIFV